MSSPARFRSDRPDLAVVALSARALACSARRGALNAVAIDLFADADTREHATLAVQARPSRGGLGFDRASLLASLAEATPEGLPVVLGAGFEHAPRLMRAIARRNPILGATPETVEELKDPVRFAALLQRLGAAHPEIRSRNDAASHPGLWLSKRTGASGGAHIRFHETPGGKRYLQRRVEGASVSALFLADGAATQIIGVSEQWSDPAPRAPFRYGGAVGPIALDPALASSIAAALDAITQATGLVGLASADMILPPTGGFVLLEINPRPGATLDVFDRPPAPSLLKLHLEACAGRLPVSAPAFRAARAAMVVYAPHGLSVASRPRPVWTADWPSCDDVIPAGDPVCTILASGVSPHAARALAVARRAALLTSLRAPLRPAPTNTTVHA